MPHFSSVSDLRMIRELQEIGRYIKQMLEESGQKVQRIVLELNKTGLSYLSNCKNGVHLEKFVEALDYLKQAQRLIMSELRVEPASVQLNKLAGITYNNLACYYKKNKKPKVALSYLKKALEREVFRVEDWVSTASTHLNICAIYSYMGCHKEAANHAQLALTMLAKNSENIPTLLVTKDHPPSGRTPDSPIHNQSSNLLSKQKYKDERGVERHFEMPIGQGQQDKSVQNVQMLSYYNLAVEYEHLHEYQQSIEQYRKARDVARLGGKKSLNVLMACQEGIIRLEELSRNQKQRLADLVTKKRVAEERGNHRWMLWNKKNVKVTSQTTGDEEPIGTRLKRYSLYRSTSPRPKPSQQTSKNALPLIKNQTTPQL